MITWALAAALALATPAGNIQPGIEESLLPDTAQIMALPPELKERLHNEIIAKSAGQQERLEMLVAFMFRPSGLGMQYRHDANLTVANTYRTREANCLSFTMLFVALAREAKLNAYAQEVQESLVWRQEENILYGTGHINAGVRIGGDYYTVDVGRDEVIARYKPQPVPDQRLLVNFYNNRAADLMAQDDMAAAMRHLQASLALDRTYASTWNNLGVLKLRMGDRDAAEHAYARALRLEPMHADTLFNLVNLYKLQGEPRLEASFQRRLQRVQQRDPYYQFLLGTQYEDKADYRNALQHYQRAVHLYASEHRFYFGLARAYLHLGNARAAGGALARAAQLGDDASRSLYQAKLQRLKQLQQ